MDRSEKAIRQKLKADFLHYAKTCLKVRTKQGVIKPLHLNMAQKHIHAKLEEQLQKTGRVRALILKGRQQGCSTYVEARFYWKLTHLKGMRAYILTHLEDATRNIYQIMKRFHEYCPLVIKPSVGATNSKELIFDKLDSGYQVGTARSTGVGRSSTLQYFHGSEVAYWPNAAEHMAGILQAVADVDGTEVILESTSAGAEGLFYTMCMEALQGRSDYQCIFVPWFWQTDYRRVIPPNTVLTAEEESYRQLYKLDIDQVLWRRFKIQELGSIWSFRREYPSTIEEAFHTDHPDALWTRAVLHRNRVANINVSEIARIVIAVDPAVTSHKNSDETGIIVAGLGRDDHGYVLADLSGKYTPAAWATVVAKAYHDYQADRVVAEVNQGGDMVEHTLRTVDTNIAYKSVRASRGKQTRAEPIAALDAQGRIHHVGILPLLEDQMCRFNGRATDHSPDRVDARIWAMTELMLNRPSTTGPHLWAL